MQLNPTAVSVAGLIQIFTCVIAIFWFRDTYGIEYALLSVLPIIGSLFILMYTE
jgi:hypothetical protein